MRYCTLLLFLTYWLSTGPLLSQNYNFINYNIGDGLAHEKVTDITEDSFGNLWIATLGGGVSCFNGIEFKNYTEKDGLSNNIVRQVTADARGNVWAATSNGISVFDGVNFKNFLIDTVQSISSVNVIAGDKTGNVWFSHPAGGLGRIDSELKLEKIKLDHWIPNDKVIDIECDSAGKVYFVTAIQGLFVYENSVWSPILTNSELRGYLLEFQIQKNGIIVLGSNKGLVFVDPAKPENFEIKRPGNFITSSISKNDTERWLISGGRAFREVDQKFSLIDDKNGFTESPVSRIYCDREQNIWFATDGDGIIKLGTDVFEFYNQSHGLYGQRVTSITQDSNGLHYISSFGAGVQILNKDNEFIPLKSPLLTHVTASTTDLTGNIWFGTRNQGIIRYDGSEFLQLSTEEGLMNSQARILYADSFNRIWVGTSSGLSIYDGVKFENLNMADGLTDNVIWGISEPQTGSVLVTTRKGVCKYSEGRIEVVDLDPKLFEKRVNIALQDTLGNYWLGYSGHGIVKTKPGAANSTYYTSDNGLSSDLIYNLLFDDNGDLIVGSERGVDKLFLDDNFELERIKSYGRVEGLYGIRTLYNSIFKDDDGDVWFGNSQGLIRYRGNNEHTNFQPPITYISEVALDYQRMDWQDWTIPALKKVPEAIKLEYDENNLIISYFGNSLTNPGAVTYQYRLLGLDDWSPKTKKREAVYTNLSSGDYVFEIRAANSDAVWSDSPAQMKISIVPPYWQEVWFYLIIGLITIFVIKLFNDYRIKKNLDKVLTIERIRAEELVKVRKRMARDFHDNMGNQLASITVFTNLIGLKLKDKSQEINDLLENIEKHTKSLFNGTKDFIWSIDPESDNLNEIYTYIKDFGEELFENTTIEFYSSTKEFGDLPLPSGWSRQIVLIFKEAMTNTLKHSNASKAHLDLNLIPNGFVIKVWDNGVGAQLDSVSRGHGFRNMKSRADQIGGNLDIHQGNEGVGICIEFKATIRSELKNNKVKIF